MWLVLEKQKQKQKHNKPEHISVCLQISLIQMK